MGAVAPALGLMRADFTLKLDAPNLSFDLPGSDAHDLAGRASSFKARVTAGRAPAEAMNLSGLICADG